MITAEPTISRSRSAVAVARLRAEGGASLPAGADGGSRADACSPSGAAALRAFERPRLAASVWQVANTLVPYAVTMSCMVLAVRHGLPWWLTAALAVPAAGLTVRLFILMHDCAHSSLLRSRRAELLLGRLLGVLVFTPFTEWRHAHLLHHATSGDLDRRGTGDIWTMTVAEYAAASPAMRLAYRLVRNPYLMLLVGPLVLFLWINRVPRRGASRLRVRSVLLTDLAIAAVVAAASLTIGFRAYLLVQLPVLFLAGACGIWLFYVQHQFEPSYWSRHEGWGPVSAALQGSSYYRLPRVLQWFSGNIGLHHVHHLRPRIPNYNLQRCMEATPELQVTRPLTIAGSLACARLALWDERAGRFVAFGPANGVRQPRGGGPSPGSPDPEARPRR